MKELPPEMTESRERHSAARLQGSWLLLARLGWVALVAFTLIVVVASLPVYLALLQTPCGGAACAYGIGLTPEQVGVLKGIGLSPGAYAAYYVAFTLAIMVVCLGVSIVIAWRWSDDGMALLVALMLVTLGPFSVTSTILAIPSSWQVPNECLAFLALALLMLVFLLFPSGQFVPRWTRWTLVVFLAGLVPEIFVAPFMPNTPVFQLGFLVLLGELAALALAQVYRYRRVSSPLQRQQTKWVVFGMALPISVFVSGTLLPLIFPALAEPHSPYGAPYQLAFNAISTFLLLLIPLSFGFAMLRYRLWEIDVLINRTLVYGALTVSLTAVYVDLIIGLQALLRGIISQDNSVAIVISTLAIYFLFQPLRRRIQRSIDRRFYRSKYDAAKTVAAFSATLRQEVDLDQLREHLLAVVQETIQPTHVSLWLRPPAPERKPQATWSSPPPATQDGEVQ
jgi:hypothetical protein